MVEGAIKQLVNRRMKRTGARWRVEHVGPLVELVALADQPEGHRYLLPDVCLSNGRFLDGGSPADLPRPVEVVATDGHQLLIRGGFALPWDGAVLIRRTALFAHRELPSDRPVAMMASSACIWARMTSAPSW